jgi:hypothetical protein
VSRPVEVPESVLLFALRAATDLDSSDVEVQEVTTAVIRAFDRMSVSAQDSARAIALTELGALRMLYGTAADFYGAREWEHLYAALAWPQEFAS